MRDASTFNWIDVEHDIADKGFNTSHSATVTRTKTSPVFIRMYSSSVYGKSVYTSELYIPRDAAKAG